MTLYLDSASLDDARTAAGLGFVRGVTTNPALLARTGKPAETQVPVLCDIVDGLVFHQLAAGTVAEREAEAHAIVGLRPGRIGLKIACSEENLSLAARLADSGLVVGVTAIFDPAQVYLACEAGAAYVLPYVNRSSRLMGDGVELVTKMREVVDCIAAPTEIIAASLKTPDEAVAAALAGAHHLTVPLSVIQAMARHELSEQAMAEFAAAR